MAGAAEAGEITEGAEHPSDDGRRVRSLEEARAGVAKNRPELAKQEGLQVQPPPVLRPAPPLN